MSFKQQIKDSIFIMSTKHIFFTGKLMATEHIEDDSIDTACTDGKSIQYNPEFFNKQHAGQRVTLIAHELAHIIFCHHLRMVGKDHELWNVATDHAINLLLVAMGFDSLDDWLCDRKYIGWSAEDIYADIQKQSESKQNQQKQQSKQSGGEFQQPSGMSSQEMEQALEEGIGDAKRAANAVSRAIKGVSRSESLTPSEKAKRVKEMGRGFSESVSQLNDIQDSQINWEDVLSRFLFSLSLDDYTYDTCDQELMQQTGFFFPTIETKAFGKVGLALDVSGSLHSISKQVASEALHTLDEVNADGLQLFYVSTHLHKTVLATSEDDIEEAKGGGTCFRSFFKHLSEEQYEFEGLIFLTDGYVDVSNWIEPTVPVLWILTNKNDNFENNVPFGECVRFNN